MQPLETAPAPRTNPLRQAALGLGFLAYASSVSAATIGMQIGGNPLGSTGERLALCAICGIGGAVVSAVGLLGIGLRMENQR